MTRNRKIIVGIVGGLIVLCCACLGISVISNSNQEAAEPGIDTPLATTESVTPESEEDSPRPLNTATKSAPTETAVPIATNTSQSATSTTAATITAAATNTTRPTNTASPPTNTAIPATNTLSPPTNTRPPATNTMPPPTAAPLPTWTLTLPPPPTDAPAPTQELPSGPPEGVPAACTCTGPDLDCGDFGTHAAAQACYNYCVGLGYGDVYDIDGNDNDGLACESLP